MGKGALLILNIVFVSASRESLQSITRPGYTLGWVLPRLSLTSSPNLVCGASARKSAEMSFLGTQMLPMASSAIAGLLLYAAFQPRPRPHALRGEVWQAVCIACSSAALGSLSLLVARMQASGLTPTHTRMSVGGYNEERDKEAGDNKAGGTEAAGGYNEERDKGAGDNKARGTEAAVKMSSNPVSAGIKREKGEVRPGKHGGPPLDTKAQWMGVNDSAPRQGGKWEREKARGLAVPTLFLPKGNESAALSGKRREVYSFLLSANVLYQLLTCFTSC